MEAEIWHFGPNLDHIFGPSSGTLGPIPKKKINLDNLPIMGLGLIFKFLASKLWEEFVKKGIKWGTLFWSKLDDVFMPTSHDVLWSTS